MLYNDAPRSIDNLLEEVARKSEPQEMEDEYGVTHRLWPVSDQATVRRIQSAMAEKKLIIADGHHRYETALNFRNEGRAKLQQPDPYAAHEFAMMTFINTHSKGLTILATHRLIKNVENFDFEKFRKAVGQYFDWYSYPFLNAEERVTAYADFLKDFQGVNHGRRGAGHLPRRECLRRRSLLSLPASSRRRSRNHSSRRLRSAARPRRRAPASPDHRKRLRDQPGGRRQRKERFATNAKWKVPSPPSIRVTRRWPAC